MGWLTYILKGFGYKNFTDFSHTVFCMPVSNIGAIKLASLSAVLGALRLLLKEYTGLDGIVFIAFVLLICAEFWTGLKASRKNKGQRFKSRKFGRMLLKIGVYLFVIFLLHSFAEGMDVPNWFGLEINPFLWLYYVVFIGITFQLFISWMENLGTLGYSETRTIAGVVLRKLNKWFEFDGTKDNGTE